MRFEEVDPQQAVGWRLAHSVRVGEKRINKGTELSHSLALQLLAAGVNNVYAYTLEDDDIHEDDAARAVATHCCGTNVNVGIATRGRCNLHAAHAGLVLVENGVNALNMQDEAITIATLPAFAQVKKGQLVATAKIIPYAAKQEQLQAALTESAKISVAPFRSFSAALLSTGGILPDKTRKLTESRLAGVSGNITAYRQCDHGLDDVTRQIRALAKDTHDLILLLGLAAISDRRDVLPAALTAAGGQIIQLGMPVDPGNLLMIGQINDKIVLGLPGCARSPALNGLDWVLERFSAGLTIDAETIRSMGVGGLLKEAPQRGEPRAPRPSSEVTASTIVLAAGKSSRARGANKLLSKLNGKPVVMATVSGALTADKSDMIVVTGHDHKSVNDALSGYDVSLVHNTAYADGMAGSLKLGLANVPDHANFTFICLADMPFVRPETYEALKASAQRISEARIFIPTYNGKRGHPTLWHRDMFTAFDSISGDIGGKHIIRENEHLVCEVAVDDPGILIDLDTPEALKQFGINT